MSKVNGFETDLLELIFQNTNIDDVGDATGLRGSTTAGSLYVALHTADPGEAGSAQTGSEVAYTNYARQAIARSGSGFTVSGNQVSNAAAVNFPQCGATGATATHWSIGVAASGTGRILYKGPLATGRLVFTAKADDTVTVPGHSLSVNDKVVAFAVEGGTLPTGLTEGTQYFVKTVSGNDITLSATQGGATLDLTAVGAGVILKATPLAIAEGITPSFAIGALVVKED